MEDKATIARMAEGVQVAFQLIDLGVSEALLGLSPGIWQLSLGEAEVIALQIARRADRGDQRAVKSIGSLMAMAELGQLVVIFGARITATGKELMANGGPKPFFLRRKAKGRAPADSGPADRAAQ